MKTMQQRFLAALLALGCKQTVSNSGKYLTVVRPKGGFYFIGKSGALRVGAVVSRSHPVHQKFKDQLLLEAPPPALPLKKPKQPRVAHPVEPRVTIVVKGLL